MFHSFQEQQTLPTLSVEKRYLSSRRHNLTQQLLWYCKEILKWNDYHTSFRPFFKPKMNWSGSENFCGEFWRVKINQKKLLKKNKRYFVEVFGKVVDNLRKGMLKMQKVLQSEIRGFSDGNRLFELFLNSYKKIEHCKCCAETKGRGFYCSAISFLQAFLSLSSSLSIRVRSSSTATRHSFSIESTRLSI